MDCDRYMELLSARLDGALTEAEERELEEHLAACPDCRAAGAQLAALREAFPELEEAATAPEGFARGVMDRIRAEKKVIPLFKRPQFRALAGLAACLVVVVGLYGASRWKTQEKMMLVTRSFQQDVLEETVDGAGDVTACESLNGDEDAPQVNAALVDPELADAPQIAAYAAPEDMDRSAKAAPIQTVERMSDSALLVMDRMPEGAEDLIAPETVVTYCPDTNEEGYRWPAGREPELLDQIERLAGEQGINTQRATAALAEEAEYDLVILEPAH